MRTELTALDEEILRAAEILYAAEHGGKTELARQLAAGFDMTTATLYRRIASLKGCQRRRRDDAGRSRDALIEKTALMVAELQAKVRSAGEDKRRLSTERAMKRLEIEGRIEAGAVNASSINRAVKAAGITAKEKTRRMDSKYANKVHVFDGSGSENLYPIEQLPDGDWLLGIRASSEKSQKNKRIRGTMSEHGAGNINQSADSADCADKKDGRRMVYYYGIVDFHSRLLFAAPTITAGESTQDGIHFLERAWRPKGDHPMVGLPEIFYTDSGPLARGREGSRLLRNLGITLEIHMPRRARAKGVIERAWRTLWQDFEIDFVFFKGETMRLSELKNMLSNFLNEYNARKSPGFYTEGKSRETAYIESLAEREIRLLPEERLIELVYREEWRVIDSCGRIQWDGYFEIADCGPDIIGERVLCLKNIRGGVVVRHPRTREWLKTRDFKPLEFGEEFRGFKKNINDEIVERALEAGRPERFLYGTAGGATLRQEGVINLTRAREEREEREEPVGFRNESEAGYFFASIAGPIGGFSEDDQGKVKNFIAENVGSREAVRMLAEGFVTAMREAAGGRS